MGKAITGPGLRALAVFSAFVFFAPLSAGAVDFGALLNQRAATVGGAVPGGPSAEYEATLVPRFTALVGDSGDIFLSAGLRVVYRNAAFRGGGETNDRWLFLPELLRTEFTWNFGDSELRVGRMTYADPMRLVATGLFDGARFSRHTAAGTFGVGAWYTGLLYKNRANISMTYGDYEAMRAEVSWNDFANTYFASRRLVAALYWEHPSIAETFRLNVALIGQADLNDRETALHSQYLIAQASMPFRRFIFEIGGAIETAQATGGPSAGFRLGLAGDVNVHWAPQTPFHSMLSFTGRFTSGRAESGPVSAFTPITSAPHGDVLRAEIGGLSMLRLNYAARLRRDLSASLAAAHFVRSDLSYDAYPLNGEGGGNFFLGTEVFGRVVWSPVSDLSLNLGAGVFLPSLGDAARSADPRWRVELAATLALR